MANPKRTNPAPQLAAVLPVPENPQHPVIQYMQDKLGAEFKVPANYKVNGLTDIPENKGNSDLFNAFSSPPLDQGGLSGSNIEARPDLYLGKDRPGRLYIAKPEDLKKEGGYIENDDGVGANGVTYNNINPRVYVNTTIQKKGDWAEGASGGTMWNPIGTTVHEMLHAQNIMDGDKQFPRGAAYNYIQKPINRAASNMSAQNNEDYKKFQQDAYDLVWPSTVNPKEYFGHRNFEEAMASAVNLEAMSPRGKLPWNLPGGAKLFNTPERQGAYIDATRSGKEPLAVNSDLYGKYQSGLPRFKVNFEDIERQAHNSRGLGGYSAIMNTRPINKVVADWFK